MTRTSRFSGVTRTFVLPITEDEWTRWQSGEYIQKAMPHLNAETREFILTGATPEEWDEEFGDDDEDGGL